MKISIISLFPSMFEGPFATSMVKKATDIGAVEISVIDLREFGIGPRRTVDDTPYGGGAGMVLKPEPLFAAVESVQTAHSHVILMSPRGKQYSQHTAKRLAKYEHLIIICGHYEGVDERVLSIVDEEVSMGDFILTGGEIPAIAVVDSMVRLLPKVLGHENSAKDESFSQGILEHPHYTRPEDFRGMKVPSELLSGHHQEIAKWRKSEAVKKTEQNRTDLIEF